MQLREPDFRRRPQQRPRHVRPPLPRHRGILPDRNRPARQLRLHHRPRHIRIRKPTHATTRPRNSRHLAAAESPPGSWGEALRSANASEHMTTSIEQSFDYIKSTHAAPSWSSQTCHRHRPASPIHREYRMPHEWRCWKGQSGRAPRRQRRSIANAALRARICPANADPSSAQSAACLFDQIHLNAHRDGRSESVTKHNAAA